MNAQTQVTIRRIRPTYRKVYHTDGTTSEMREGLGRSTSHFEVGTAPRIVVREYDKTLNGWTRERMDHPNNELA